MRRELVLVVAALAMVACTPLRPLDPGPDAARDAALEGLDAQVLDAPGLDAPGLDAFLPEPDAPTPDAPGLDAFSADAPVVLPDAYTSDAALAPDAVVLAPDAWRAADAGPLDGLVAWYPFDRTTDATGNGHTLMSSGVDYAGAIATFEGGDVLTTPDAVDLDTVLAISLWARPAELPAGPARAGLVDRNTYLGLFLHPEGVVRCTSSSGATTVDSPRGTVRREDWVHLLCVHEGGRLALYADGLEVAGRFAPTPPPRAMEPLSIGSDCCTGADPYTGDLSDVRLWSRPPTASEIAEMVAAVP